MLSYVGLNKVCPRDGRNGNIGYQEAANGHKWGKKTRWKNVWEGRMTRSHNLPNGDKPPDAVKIIK